MKLYIKLAADVSAMVAHAAQQGGRTPAQEVNISLRQFYRIIPAIEKPVKPGKRRIAGTSGYPNERLGL